MTLENTYIKYAIPIFVVLTLLVLFLKQLYRRRKYEDGFGELVYTEERFNYSRLIGIMFSLGVVLLYFILIKKGSYG